MPNRTRKDTSYHRGWRTRWGSGVRRVFGVLPFRKRGLLAAVLLGVMLAVTFWCDGFFLAGVRNCTVLRDLDGDGRAEELTIQWQRLQVRQNGGIVFVTEADWRVEDFLLGDINQDGAEELLLLVWKRGSYGKVRPFWVERDETGWSQHIYIYQWKGGVKPIWMSSRLRPEVAEWSLTEDGFLRIQTPRGEDTRWEYRGFGLSRLDGERVPF